MVLVGKLHSMSPTRRYFRKAVTPPEPTQKSPAWQAPYIQGIGPDGSSRVYIPEFVRLALQRSKGGKAVHARKRAKCHFTPETARKAALKRWRTRNRILKGAGGGAGLRVGQGRKRAPKLDYVALRNHYSQWRDDWKVLYDAGARVWLVRDDHGERRVSERTALKYAGVLKRGSLMGTLPREFRGIDLKAEGWNPD